MATLLSAPLPELDWPTLTVIEVDAGDPSAVIESLIILVSEDAPGLPGDEGGAAGDDIIPLYVYAEPNA